MKIHYCTICRKIIIGKDYFEGINFYHHRVCHIRVYGMEFDD